VPQSVGIIKNPIQAKNSNTKKSTTRTIKKNTPVKAILITLMIIVILAASSFIVLGFYVDSLDTIFPNVWADGVNVSGMTLQDAVAHLIYVGYEDNAEGISATVIFPDNTSFSITGNDVGLSFNAMEAALAAFAFGRDDTFFRNEIQYIRSLFERTELNDLSTPVYDDSFIRLLAAEYTERFNTTLFNSSLVPNNEYITIIRGSGLHPAIEENVHSLAINTLRQAISTHDNITVRYSPEENAGDSIEAQIYELQLLFDEIHDDAISAQWDVDTLSATTSSNGRTFDLEQAISSLRNAANGQRIIVEIETLEPEYTKEFFESVIFAHKLSDSTTREASGNSNRLGNIQLAANKINGTVINPGNEFSFNEIVGRRTVAAGFRAANTIRNGIFEPGIGGGICQVSSTLHDAVLHTSLEVVERTPHGLRIAYMPVGDEGTVLGNADDVAAVGGRRFANDAMVNWGTNDYRFKNNTDFPIKIVATVSGRNLTIELWGTRLNENNEEDKSYFVVETVILERFQSGTTEQLADWLPEGTREVHEGAKGQFGYRVETFKLHFSEDGELLSRTEISRRRYNAQSQIILIGTAPIVEAPPPVDTTPQPTPDPGDGGEGGDDGDSGGAGDG